MFAAWLAVTAVAMGVTVVLYARDLSKPQAGFTLAVFALLAAGFALLATFNAWARRKNLKKIDQAGKAATALAGTRDSTASEAIIETKARWLAYPEERRELPAGQQTRDQLQPRRVSGRLHYRRVRSRGRRLGALGRVAAVVRCLLKA